MSIVHFALMFETKPNILNPNWIHRVFWSIDHNYLLISIEVMFHKRPTDLKNQ